jgi:lipopolysaccharide biosynthesis regulator YciM
LELNPREGEYLGLWAHMESLKRPPGSELEDLVEKMKKALTFNPKSERVLLYMGKILKRQNKHHSSQLFFQEVLEVNPKNVEAAREVQLWKIRNKNKKAKEEKSGGILKRFFK